MTKLSRKDKEEYLLAIAPVILDDARKLGADIHLRTTRAPGFSWGSREWLVTGTIDGWPVIGYVSGKDHALWFADSII